MAPPSRQCLLLVSALGVLVLGRLLRGQNSTLIFTRENAIRNCSCSADVPDCDYSLASLVCSCETVLPLSAGQASYHGHLTIWFSDTSVLGLLLNFTLVQDLKLSLCSTNILPSEYLAIWGLQRLRVHAEAKQPSAEHSLLIHDGGDNEFTEEPVSLHADRPMWMGISFLDMALFNKESSLKSYSIANITNVTNSFPSFPYFKTVPIPSNKSYIVTFIY